MCEKKSYKTVSLFTSLFPYSETFFDHKFVNISTSQAPSLFLKRYPVHALMPPRLVAKIIILFFLLADDVSPFIPLKNLFGKMALSSFPVPPPDASAVSPPPTWEMLEDVITTNTLHRLGRSPPDLVIYKLYMASVREEWWSLSDFIAAEKFGTLFKRVEEERERDGVKAMKYAISPTLNDNDFGETVSLHKNDFPYHTPPNVEHLVLWVLNRGVTENDLEEAKGKLKAGSQEGEQLDFLTWTNPPELKSVPEIDHAHLLVRRRKPVS